MNRHEIVEFRKHVFIYSMSRCYVCPFLVRIPDRYEIQSNFSLDWGTATAIRQFMHCNSVFVRSLYCISMASMRHMLESFTWLHKRKLYFGNQNWITKWRNTNKIETNRKLCNYLQYMYIHSPMHNNMFEFDSIHTSIHFSHPHSATEAIFFWAIEKTRRFEFVLH